MSRPNLKDSKLRRSIRNFGDGFYDYIKEKELWTDDYEFGTWDHMFLSAFLAYWMANFKKYYHEPLFETFEKMNSDDIPYKSEVLRGLRVDRKILELLEKDFLAKARGEGDAFEDPLHRRVMRRFNRFYNKLWD